MKYLILDRESKEVIHRYEADQLTPHGGRASSGLHVQIPDELELRTAVVELSEDAPVIYEEYVRVLVEVPQEPSELGMLQPVYEEQLEPVIILKGTFSGPLAKTEADKEQERVNAEALAFLAECDWKRQRHISQKALGIATSLSEAEYLALEQACQDARNRIVR